MKLTQNQIVFIGLWVVALFEMQDLLNTVNVSHFLNKVSGALGGAVACFILPGIIYGIIRIFKRPKSTDWIGITAIVFYIISWLGRNTTPY